jgi:hypothetical protein
MPARARHTVTMVALLALLSSLVLPARPVAVLARAHKKAVAVDVLQTPAAAPSQRTPEQARDSYGKVGMSFEENRGQTDGQVKFLARGSGYTLFLTQTEAVFVMARHSAEQDASRAKPLVKGMLSPGTDEAPTPELPPAVLRMKLEGANPQPTVSGRDELEGKVNYFIGNEPDKWHTNIPTFSRVHHENVYEGVDMVFYGNQQQLEYDFVVSAGADTRQIELSFDGADRMDVDAATGDLLLEVGGATLRQHKPFVYQEVDGERREIESGYERKGGGRVGFTLGSYDRAMPLVIDPVLSYSTFLGGSGNDGSGDIAVDAAGNAYVIGSTDSLNFPTTNGFDSNYNGGREDAVVTKLNAAGSALVYSTYLGGGGSDVNSGLGIAVDSAGNAYVTGSTSSRNFPVANPLQATYAGGSFDAFVTKISPTGSALIYSTYLGGGTEADVGIAGGDSGNAIALDTTGNAYVIGYTNSPNFPTANALQATYGGGVLDVIVTKLNPTGSALIYSTFLGGNGNDAGNDIAVDSAGNAYLTEQAGSNFPTANAFDSTFGGGSLDGFVTKLNPAGSALAYSTYLGGTGFDNSLGIAVDVAGNAYVTGVTGPNFPIANPIQGVYGGGANDAFVTKFNSTGNGLIYST